MHERDVERYDRLAPRYERGFVQRRFFAPMQRSALEVALAGSPPPRRMLDVGCGTGALLRLAAKRLPEAELTGVDASEGMLRVAGKKAPARSPAIRFVLAPAEALPFSDATFDLVVSTVSFHHWSDQPKGIAEAARVLVPGGRLVLTDHFALPWLRPAFAAFGHRHRIHTREEIAAMMAEAGLSPEGWDDAYRLGPLPLVTSATGVKQG